MRAWSTVALSLTAAGCAGSSDDCQRFVDKSKPVLAGMGKDSGKTLGHAELTMMAEMCRKEAKTKADPVFKCVLDASAETAVRDCDAKAMGSYADKSKRVEATLQLRALGRALQYAYEDDKTFPVGKTGPIPATPCCQETAKATASVISTATER